VNRSDFVHFVSIPIRWGDMDALGHVNNAMYFRYAESGRIAYFATIGADAGLAGGGEGPILADIQCSFLGQVRYPAQLEIGTRTAKLGTKSFTIDAGMFLAGDDAPVATSRAVVVWFDYDQQTSAPLPEALRQRVLEFEAVTPTE
jgi:acyl-CoA thioester hydrolase